MSDEYNALLRWIEQQDDVLDQIARLHTQSARIGFSPETITPPDTQDIEAYDWKRLLLIGSIFATSPEVDHQNQALVIAQGAILVGETNLFKDAGASILTQLFNQRGISLAEDRELLIPNIGSRVGVTESLLMARRELDSLIVVNEKISLQGNPFQLNFWKSLQGAKWVSATAPTAAGKTYLMLNWLLNRYESGEYKLGVFLAPTRALVTEIAVSYTHLTLPTKA